MRYFTAVAALVAVAAAHYSEVVAESSCTAPVIVTVTMTETLAHTPNAPGTPGYYPTTGVSEVPVVPSGGVASSSGIPVYTPLPSETVPVGTGYTPAPPAGTAPPAGGASGTASYSAAVPEFTGAATNLKVGGALAGVGAIAALFL